MHSPTFQFFLRIFLHQNCRKMKLQVVKCSLVGLLGVLFVTNVQGFRFPKHERQLCEASGEPCISYDETSSIGPRCWFKIDFPNEKCCNENGKFQSPIDIPDVKKKFIVSHKLRYSSNKFEGKFENTGIQPNFKRESDDKVYLEGIGSKHGERYFLENVHFHVGPEHQERQTEHLKNGKTFDGEAHLVHVREDFGTVQRASTDPQGLLVISIFLTTSGRGKRSDAFDDLIEIIPKITDFDFEDGPCAEQSDFVKFLKVVGLDIDGKKFIVQCRVSFADNSEGDSPSMGNKDTCNFYLRNGKCGDTTEETINPNELLSDKPEYYFYSGGLTTPPCSEAVVWVIAKRPRRVSFFYPFVVRSLKTQIGDGEILGDFGNLRPLQDLEGRKVFLLRFDPSFWKGIFDRIKKGKYADAADAADADGDTILKDGPLSMLM